MPYIPQKRRESIASWAQASTAGELNYAFSKAIVDYITRHKLSYQSINDVIGALEGAQAEFYRRVAIPYEDIAIERNGDVYQDIIPG